MGIKPSDEQGVHVEGCVAADRDELLHGGRLLQGSLYLFRRLSNMEWKIKQSRMGLLKQFSEGP